MKPKKKSMAEPIIAIVSLIFVLLIALYVGMGAEQAYSLLEQGSIQTNQLVMEIVSQTAERMAYYPNEIYFTPYTLRYIEYFAFAWLIVILMIVNSKKNYIHGKEFGTAHWGTLSDIKDLFASSIAKNEIKRAKKLKTKIGRYFVKKELLSQCEKDGRFALKERLANAEKEEYARKRNKTANKQLYKEEIKNIKADVKKEVEEAKIQAWKPDRYKRDCDEEIAEIKKSNFFSDEERKVRIKEAERKYHQRVADFYDIPLRIMQIKDKYSNADMIFTKEYKMSFYNYILNQNVMILGGSGAGKTRGYVLPNVLQAHSSYIITDPKGEILEKAGYFLEKIKGYKIRVLNLDEKKNSDGYNPFDYIHPEREGYEERVLSLIETIIINTDGEKKGGSSDPFWDKAERLFLQSIFFFTVDGFVPEDRNMGTVMKLIGMLEIAEEEDNYDSDLDYFAKVFEEKFGKDHIGIQQYKEFRSKASGKTAKSIVISAVARLAPFRTSEVRRLFSYDNMNLDRVGEEKYAIFVVTPPTDKSFNFIAGMLFTQLFQELQYCATQVHKHDGQRLPVPCRFILDEFYNTAQIPNFPQILSYARSFGIGITIILQSLEQIKAMYEKEYGVVIDNCNTILYLGSINHKETLEYMSQLLGKGTFDKRTTGRTRGRQGSSSENFDVVGRELMFPDDIRQIPKDECILVLGGRPPFYDKKYIYETHENYRFTSDGNPRNSYEYVPLPPPKRNSHGEKIVIPTADSFIDVPQIKFNPNEDMSLVVADIADDVKNGRVEFMDALGADGSDEEYLALAEELEAENLSTLTDLVGANQVLEDIEIETPKIEILSCVDTLRALGRSFRKQEFVPTGFVGGASIEELSEEEQDEAIKEIEQILFEEEEEEPIIDDSLDEAFASNLNTLLDSVSDDDLFGAELESLMNEEV